MERIRLNLTHLEDVISLQGKCLSSLPDDQDLIHPKTSADFEGILTSPFAGMWGLIENERLLAQAVAIWPEHTTQADMLNMRLAVQMPQTLVTIAGVIVDPNVKGRGLMSGIIHACQEAAIRERPERQNAVAMVTDTNVPSLAGFLSVGMEAVEIAHDPSDNSTVYLLHGLIDAQSQKTCRRDFGDAVGNSEKTIITPDMTLEHRRAVFESGHVGVSLIRDAEGTCTSALEMLLSLHDHPQFDPGS